MGSIALATLLVATLQMQQDAAAAPDLRSRIEAAAKDGISAPELKTLADETLLLARAATSRTAFWGAVGLLGVLCESGPCVDARDVRARTLQLLAQRDSDTMRWSSLMVKRFLPAFARIPRTLWAEELAAYDRLLDALYAEAAVDRVRAELLYAKGYCRVFINRRWDWLSEQERRKTLGILASVEDQFSALTLPGSAEPKRDTVGQRARQHEHELRNLFFGAAAPPTSGVDLEGKPLDLSDHRGQVVVLDFWTSFCQPCLALVPGVRKLMGELEDEPVVYLGVNGDTDRLAGLATARRFGMTWRNLWDGPLGPGGPAATAWNVPALGWPSVFVLDAEGHIRYKLRGKEQVDNELEDAIRTLLAEKGKSEGQGDR